MSTSAPALVIAAHGSGDPDFAAVVSDLAGQVRRSRPGLDVRVGYLEHGPPHLSDVAGAGTVVVPLLLSSGYHVGADIPAQAGGAAIAAAIGPDPRLVPVLAARLRQAGWTTGTPVMLAATGSTEAAAVEDVRRIGPALGAALGGVDVTVAFVSAGSPRLHDLPPAAAVSSYLLARGHYSRILIRSGSGLVSAPLGAAPELTEIILDRYDAAADRLELV